jgi:hypothetical protein
MNGTMYHQARSLAIPNNLLTQLLTSWTLPSILFLFKKQSFKDWTLFSGKTYSVWPNQQSQSLSLDTTTNTGQDM